MKNHILKQDQELQLFAFINNATNSATNNININYRMDEASEDSKTDEFMPLTMLVKRDIKTESVEVYQVQAEKNEKVCNLVYIGKYTNIPVECILNFDHREYHCDLISFSMDRDEIINQVQESQCLRMIGFLIQKEGKIVASLEYMFEPETFIDLKKKKRSVFGIKGKFLIKLNTKKNNIYKTIVIRQYIDYSGREESIYLLTSLIIEDDIIDRIESEQ